MKKILRPHILIKIALTIFSVYGLVGFFAYSLDLSFWIYAIYAISTYTLVIDCIWIYDIAMRLKNFALRFNFVQQWAGDLGYRAKTALLTGLTINILYGIFVGYLGLKLQSVWWGTLAFYYLILWLARFNMLRSINSTDTAQGWRIYTQTGWLIIILILVVTGMGIVSYSGTYACVYKGYTIYAMAAYTFYLLGLAVYSIIQYRKLKNPIYMASKAISLAIGLVSLYSLQLAMLSIFSEGDINSTLLNGITGGCIAVFEMAIGVYMIVRKKI